jgi:hypothetical protein
VEFVVPSFPIHPIFFEPLKRVYGNTRESLHVCSVHPFYVSPSYPFPTHECRHYGVRELHKKNEDHTMYNEEEGGRDNMGKIEFPSSSMLVLRD